MKFLCLVLMLFSCIHWMLVPYWKVGKDAIVCLLCFSFWNLRIDLWILLMPWCWCWNEYKYSYHVISLFWFLPIRMSIYDALKFIRRWCSVIAAIDLSFQLQMALVCTEKYWKVFSMLYYVRERVNGLQISLAYKWI
jgi:hypothetical protein